MTTTEPSPYPVGSAWERTYGRSVWAMGGDGDDGLLVEGHDRRSWAALSCYARHEQLVPVERSAITVRWMTYREECGCTPEQHAEHQDTLASNTRSDSLKTCQDLTVRGDCDSFPPCCTDGDLAWMATWYDDPANLPEGALPVLVWGW